MMIVFFIVLVLIILILGAILSTLSIRIDKLCFSNQRFGKRKMDYLVFLELYLFGVVKVITLRIDQKKVERIARKWKVKERMQEVNLKQMKQELPTKDEQIKLLKKLKIQLKMQ